MFECDTCQTHIWGHKAFEVHTECWHAAPFQWTNKWAYWETCENLAWRRNRIQHSSPTKMKVKFHYSCSLSLQKSIVDTTWPRAPCFNCELWGYLLCTNVQAHNVSEYDFAKLSFLSMHQTHPCTSPGKVSGSSADRYVSNYKIKCCSKVLNTRTSTPFIQELLEREKLRWLLHGHPYSIYI